MNSTTHVVQSELLQAEIVMKHRARADQGPSLAILARDESVTLLRFDCYAMDPHYHYEPGSENQERLGIESATYGDATQFALFAVRQRLRDMLRSTRRADLANRLDAADHDKFATAIERAVHSLEYRNTAHDVQGEPFDLGPVRLFVRRHDDGITMHFTAGPERREFLCLDCYGPKPHYHCEPLRADIVRHIDTRIAADSIEWGLDVVASGRVLQMFADTGRLALAARLIDYPFAKFAAQELRPCIDRLLERPPSAPPAERA